MRLKKMNNYEDYFICDSGQILSFKISTKISILTPIVNNNGYCYVKLSRDGGCKSKSLHRLVASNFLPNPYNKPEVNHIDGDKTNNKANNLEWCTSSENSAHAIRTGLKKALRGSKCILSKLKEHEVLEIRKMLNSGIRQKVIAEKYKISIHTVSSISRNIRWQHLK
jgi:hypothetical protein